MDNPQEWTALDPDQLISPIRRRLLSASGVVIDPQRLLSMLAADPLTQDFLRAEAWPTSIPTGTIGYIVPGTRLFINRARSKDLSWDAITSGGVFVLTGSLTLTAGLQLLQRAVRMMRLLSEEEADLAIVLAALSKGQPYDVAVTDAQITAAYEEDSARSGFLLTRMHKRGLIERVDGGWRLVK